MQEEVDAPGASERAVARLMGKTGAHRVSNKWIRWAYPLEQDVTVITVGFSTAAWTGRE